MRLIPQRYRIYAAAIIGLIFFASCSSVKFDVATFDKAYKDGNYELCVKMLQNKEYGEENQVLKNIDVGVMAHYAKDYAASASCFDEGDRLLDAGDLRSIAQFESFYLNILNALNYYHLGKLEDAAAEIKKVDDEKVRTGRENSNSYWYIVDHSGNVDLIRGFDEDEEPSEEVKNAYKTFGIKPADVNKGLPRKPVVGDLYQGSPTAYYLGSLLRNANDDAEGARLSKDYLKVLNPAFSSDTLKQKDGKACLNVLAFSGAIAQKEEVVFYFPEEKEGKPQFLPSVSIPILDPETEEKTMFTLPPIRFKFAYPMATENVTQINHIEAVISNSTGVVQTCPLTLLEDFGEDLKKNVALKARREYHANVAKSLIGKLSTSIASATAIFSARKAVEQADGLKRAVAEITLDVAEKALPIALEKFDEGIYADVRQSKFLPAKSSAADVLLDPGVYTVNIRYLHDAHTVHEDVFENIEIKAKGLNLLESIWVK